MIGEVVGKYRLIEQIGEGGMGVVMRAEHTVLGSPAAVKILLSRWSQDAIVVDRFFHEAKAASAIRHVGIVEVFDYGRLPNNRGWIAMEHLRGETLGQFFDRSRRAIDPALALQISMQVLAALDAAHVAGVVHRDLKPDNVFLLHDPSAPSSLRVKVLDFGIAKLSERFSDKTKTRAGTILGTPPYMAPEQCKADKKIDARVDLYALGCMLFELLTGRPPFMAESGSDIMAMHIYEPPPRLATYAPALPIELDALLAKLLVKEPADRVPSAAYALAALERVQLSPASTAPTVAIAALDGRLASHAPRMPRSRRGRRSGMPRWVPIVVVLVAVAIFAAFLIGHTGAKLGK